MLWQFLGVLADRLDQTSSELRNAKRELAAEDMTAEIFPEIDAETESPAPSEPVAVIETLASRRRDPPLARSLRSPCSAGAACEPRRPAGTDAAPAEPVGPGA